MKSSTKSIDLGTAQRELEQATKAVRAAEAAYNKARRILNAARESHTAKQRAFVAAVESVAESTR